METYTKTALKIGQRFRLKHDAQQLFVHDAAELGFHIGNRVDTGSGELSLIPIVITNLLETNPHAVLVEATRKGELDASINVCLTLKLLFSNFEEVPV